MTKKDPNQTIIQNERSFSYTGSRIREAKRKAARERLKNILLRSSSRSAAAAPAKPQTPGPLARIWFSLIQWLKGFLYLN